MLALLLVGAFVISIGGSNFAAAKQGNKGAKQEAKQQEKEIKASAKEAKEVIKQSAKEIKNQMKEEVKKKYTKEETEKLEATAKELKAKYKNIQILAVENILAKGKNLKFDVPPVIKAGRTLIPVRAISQAFGATVQWNAEEQKVTVIKGDIKILLQLGSRTVYVNGTAVEIDVPAEALNGRTVVPLRFIIENLGLKVQWDEETGTIEIEDPAQEPSQQEGTEETTEKEAVEAEEPAVEQEKEAPAEETPADITDTTVVTE